MAHFSRRLVFDLLRDHLDADFVVQDATRPFRVMTKQSDCRLAKRIDPYDCVFGKACQRVKQPGLIYRSVAYITRSRKLVEKFQVDRNARATILANDVLTGADRKFLLALHGQTLVLMPPKGQRRVGSRAHNRRPGLPSRRSKPASPAAIAARLKMARMLQPLNRAFQLG